MFYLKKMENRAMNMALRGGKQRSSAEDALDFSLFYFNSFTEQLFLNAND